MFLRAGAGPNGPAPARGVGQTDTLRESVSEAQAQAEAHSLGPEIGGVVLGSRHRGGAGSIVWRSRPLRGAGGVSKLGAGPDYVGPVEEVIAHTDPHIGGQVIADLSAHLGHDRELIVGEPTAVTGQGQ